MRGKVYIFALPLLFASVMTFPGIQYACASVAAKHVLPYAQMEYATRRSYTVGKTPVTLHVYPGSRDAVAPLVQILKDVDSPHRNEAVTDVGIIGPPAAEAVPYLSQILRDRSRDLSYRASQSLVKIGGAGIDALIQALSADEDRVRLVAIVALQNAGTAGRAAIPELEKRWSKEDPSIRSQIDIAISNLRRTRNEL
jgi:HEAT repeat protein